MIAQIQVRRGTTAEWAAAAPVVLAAGELGYDTTLKRLKVGDGATAWVDLPWADYGTNPNILHNWDLRNPINQRNVSGTLTGFTGGYFIDRWKLYGGVSILSGYVALRENSSIQHRIKGTFLAGSQVTITAESNIGISITTLTVPTTVGRVDVAFPYFDKVACLYSSTSEYIAIQLYTADYIRSIYRVKVELGSSSTLANDPPMDHAAELLKCQRFAQIRSSNSVSAVDMRPTMRLSSPTITAVSGGYLYSADL